MEFSKYDEMSKEQLLVEVNRMYNQVICERCDALISYDKREEQEHEENIKRLQSEISCVNKRLSKLQEREIKVP